MKSKFALMLTIILLVVLAMGIVPVYAQEAATVEPTTTSVGVQESRPVAGVAEAEPQTVGSGATTLILLVGLLAVGAVGFGAFMRSSNRQPSA